MNPTQILAFRVTRTLGWFLLLLRSGFTCFVLLRVLKHTRASWSIWSSFLLPIWLLLTAYLYRWKLQQSKSVGINPPSVFLAYLSAGIAMLTESANALTISFTLSYRPVIPIIRTWSVLYAVMGLGLILFGFSQHDREAAS